MAHWIIKKNIGDLPVCIFSNDCWGGEFYRSTGRPYNTPFVGLMLMAPCYLKLLAAPRHYFNQELEFTSQTKYKKLQELNQKRPYPIGLLGEVEVHFLHYKSQSEAAEKWNRRKNRIDWDHLFVKFCMDKDYATRQCLEAFQRLPYKNKICFSRQDYLSPVNYRLHGYVEDGARLFTQSFREVDMLEWFRSGDIRPNSGWNRVVNPFIGRFLKTTLQ